MAKKTKNTKAARKRKPTPKATGKVKDVETFKVRIEHHYPDEDPKFSNHLVVQFDGPEMHLSFFEVKPPMVLGTPAEQTEQLKQLQAVRARCVARVVVSRERMGSFLKVMQENYEKAAKLAKGGEKPKPEAQ